MRKIGGRLSLPSKPFYEQRVGAELGIENLERHGPVEQKVLGAVDHGHAAAVNEMGYLIPI